MAPLALHKNFIVCLCFSPAIRDTRLPRSWLSAQSKNVWNLGLLRLHLQAPYSKHWSGSRRVCRTCSATHAWGLKMMKGENKISKTSPKKRSTWLPGQPALHPASFSSPDNSIPTHGEQSIALCMWRQTMAITTRCSEWCQTHFILQWVSWVNTRRKSSNACNL